MLSIESSGATLARLLAASTLSDRWQMPRSSAFCWRWVSTAPLAALWIVCKPFYKRKTARDLHDGRLRYSAALLIVFSTWCFFANLASAGDRETQIVGGCGVSSEGVAYVAAACIGGALSTESLVDCLNGSCFGANNTIIKNIGNIFGRHAERKPVCGNFIVKFPNFPDNLIIRPGKIWNLCSGYRVTFQGDGNFVVYNRTNKAVYATLTKGANELAIQGDGNMVILRDHHPVFDTKTAGTFGDRLAIQEDGNVVIYRPDDVVLWKTNTTVSENDLLIWDHLGTIHRAIADYGPGEIRLMRRCQVMATKVFKPAFLRPALQAAYA